MDPNYDLERPDNIVNNITLSTPFEYPEESENTEEMVKNQITERLTEMLTKMAIFILATKNPHLTMVCLFYAAGVDLSIVYGCKNTETDLAKLLSMPKQTFSLEVKKVRQQFKLEHSSTKMYGKTPEAFKNNYQR